MGRTVPLWMLVGVAASAAGGTCGCSLLFPYAPASTDAAVEPPPDGSPGIDAGPGVDASAGLDAGPDAACPPGGEDADGDGSPCGTDCDDQDWLLRPEAPWPTFAFEEIAPSSGQFDVELAEDGALVVLYAQAGSLYLATRASPNDRVAEWTIEDVDDARAAPQQIDLALGPAARYACYWDNNGGGPLRVWSGVARETAEIFSAPDGVGPQCAITLDGNGLAHVAFYDSTSQAVRHTVRGAGVWAAPTLVGPGTVLSSRITAGTQPNGEVLIAYASDAEALILATPKGNGWLRTPVPAALGRHPFVVLEDVLVHLAFRASGSGDTSYTSGTIGGAWEPVEIVTQQALAFSLATQSGTPVVAWDEGPTAARISWRTGPQQWELAALTLGVEGEMVMAPRIVYDLSERLHVVFADEAEDNLWHGVLVDPCPPE